MSKFKAGDKLWRPPHKELLLTILSVETDNYRVCFAKDTDISSFPIKHVDLHYVLSTSTTSITLGPEEKWSPVAGLVLPDKHCLHTWREVLLLTSTVTECSKCWVLRE